MDPACDQSYGLLEVYRQACPGVKAEVEIRSEEGGFIFRKTEMPIVDEGRRLGRTKPSQGTTPQIGASAEAKPEPKERVQESLQRLYEMVELQRAEQGEFCEREEKRI